MNLTLHTVDELLELRYAESHSLSVLAPYNGTVAGARAISEGRARIEAIDAELASRGSALAEGGV